MKKTALILLAFVVATAVCVRPAAAAPSPDIVAMMKRSLVAVVCVNPQTESIAASIGTAFFVDANGSIVTAAHVWTDVTAAAASRSCTPAVYVEPDGWHHRQRFTGRSYPVQACFTDATNDLALCSLEGTPFADAAVTVKPLPVHFNNDEPDDGTAIAFTGFPLSNVTPIRERQRAR